MKGLSITRGTLCTLYTDSLRWFVSLLLIICFNLFLIQGTGSAQSESPLTEVERTLKSLNGYHEDILEALHTVSQQRHHQKSLECIRSGLGSGPGSGTGSGGGGPSSGGDGSGPASLGRQTPNDLNKKAYLESDYGGKFSVPFAGTPCFHWFFGPSASQAVLQY